jgi:hypothetical protein
MIWAAMESTIVSVAITTQTRNRANIHSSR